MNEPNNLKTKSYNVIKNKIITGEYQDNHIILEDSLQEELGISRTPIREALIKLQSENFVEIIPRRGVFVSQLTVKMTREIFEIRQLIEPQILRNSFSDINKDEIQKIRDDLTKDLSSFTDTEKKNYLVKVDSNLHMMLLEQNGNTLLINTMQSILDHNQRLRFATFYTENRDSDTLMEHLDIIDAILSDDVQAAHDALVYHIEKSGEVAIKQFMYR